MVFRGDTSIIYKEGIGIGRRCSADVSPGSCLTDGIDLLRKNL
jgi:hypothetical protein